MLRLGRGHLDICRADGAGAVVSGYYQFLDFGGVEAFEARVGGRPVRVLEQRLGEDSPDIALLRHCRELPRAARCRFQVRLAAGAGEIGPHTLIELAPVSRHGRGLGVRKVHEPRTRRPDQAAIDSVGGGYEDVAHEFLSYMIDLAGLRRDARVLDVGCGIGRMALGLSAHLDRGSYRGLDVMPHALQIARATFAHDARFSFEHVDVHNAWYNPRGRLRSTEVRLGEFANDRADFVLMSSLLTHLFPADAEHYLREARGVLAPDGAVLATAWLMNERTKPLVTARRSAIQFVDRNGYWVEDDSNPESALAHEAEWFLGAVERSGFRIERLVPGFWSGIPDGLAFQDLLVLRPM